MLAALDRALSSLEVDSLLRDPAQWSARARALDRLELLALDADAHPALSARVRALRDAFDAADHALFCALRDAVRAGQGRAALAPFFVRSTPEGDDGYDALDALLAGVLALEEPVGPLASAGPEMVFYQPTPARSALELLALTDLGATDVVLDLGSGLGHVALLGAILSDARFVGVERDPAYVRVARECARSLSLERASFCCEDILEASLDEATVIYLFTPCTGALLDRVIQRIRQQSQRRPLRVASLGPASFALEAQRWLRPRVAVQRARIALFDAIEPDASLNRR